MAGLTAACELLEQGVDVVVLEASERAGGRVKPVTTVLGSQIDIGGQWVGFGHHRLETLAKRSRSTVYKTYSNEMPIIIHKGSKISLLTPAVLFCGLILVMFDLLCKLPLPRRWNRISVAKAITTVSPSKTAQKLLQTIMMLSAAAELKKVSIYALAKSVSISGGLFTMLGNHGGAQDSLIVESIGSLAELLATRLGPQRFRTGMRVVSIEQSEGMVSARTTSGEEITATKVIVAMPPPVQRSISFDPPLSPERMALQQTTRMGVVYKAVAIFDKPFWRNRHGGEYLILDDPPCGISDTSPPNGPGHLCLLVGGTPARDLDALDTNVRREKLLAPLVPYMGREVLEPLGWHEKSWHLDEFCGGGYMAMAQIGSTYGFLPMPYKPVGNIHWAGTETSDEHPGYVEGALQSGQRAAKEIIDVLAK